MQICQEQRESTVPQKSEDVERRKTAEISWTRLYIYHWNNQQKFFKTIKMKNGEQKSYSAVNTEIIIW